MTELKVLATIRVVDLISRQFLQFPSKINILMSVLFDEKELSHFRTAKWITSFDTSSHEYCVYHFRKTFLLENKPDYFLIHVTADNRYRLFVNSEPVISGPARGYLSNWYYESIDIASFLKQGYNTIAALVWNMGDLAPLAQISNQTGFFLQGNGGTQEIINTNESWKVFKSRAYKPCSLDNMDRLQAYMVVGPGDEVDGRLYLWDWEKLNFNDDNWPNAKILDDELSVKNSNVSFWILKPRNIPFLEEKLIRFNSVCRVTGINISVDFLNGKSPLTVPPNNKVSILVDQNYLSVAYPELLVSGGWGTSIMLTYAEALFDSNGLKGNRNDINNKLIYGNYDIYRADGEDKRLFRPLWLRTYRYVQLDIITQNESLVIEDFYAMRTGYPLIMNATFSCNDTSLQDIWNVGWRTAQNCAGESYYDTPYYEQLQYAGDSRIQALITLYISGDDRLMRKCITDIFHSRITEGLTQSRYPSKKLQVIPAFSLFWISMIYDYWMHRRDDNFVNSFLPAIIEIINWFKERIDEDKQMLGPLTWWNFVDWDNFNGRGTAPGAEEGNSAIVSLQYAYTLNQAADLFWAFDNIELGNKYKSLAAKIGDNTYFHCFNQDRGLMADTPYQTTYSQHANIWTILSDTLNLLESRTLLATLLKDKSINQVTYFYRFYLTQALKKVGMADLYYGQLTPWRDMLEMGLTTFAEKPEPTRSDCHAWSASPNYDFLATICGIMPASPGFDTVLIKPALGELKEVSGKMPHPLGHIVVSFKITDEHVLKSEIFLPDSLTGTFIWKDISHNLQGGMQYFTL